MAPDLWERRGLGVCRMGRGKLWMRLRDPLQLRGREGIQTTLKWHPAHHLGRPPLPVPRFTSRGPPDPESGVLSAPSVNTPLPASPAQPTLPAESHPWVLPLPEAAEGGEEQAHPPKTVLRSRHLGETSRGPCLPAPTCWPQRQTKGGIVEKVMCEMGEGQRKAGRGDGQQQF